MINDPQDRLITVRAARQDGRVALWERHPDHPEGEIFVAPGSGPVRAARTPLVLRALADGALREQAPATPEGDATPGRRKAARSAAGEQA